MNAIEGGRGEWAGFMTSLPRKSAVETGGKFTASVTEFNVKLGKDHVTTSVLLTPAVQSAPVVNNVGGAS